MIPNIVSSIVIFSVVGLNGLNPAVSTPDQPQKNVLTKRSISLENRQINKPLNDIYKDNILLNMAYMRGLVSTKAQINWDEIRKPFVYDVNLKPGEVFAYHDSVLQEYDGKVVKNTNSHFSAAEGYISDGNLFGMGVCHSASLINWAAKDAGLNSVAPSNHDFAVIREVDKKYGVAIYSSPESHTSSARQNLYITNNFEQEVTLKFEYDGVSLGVSILK